MSKKNTVEIICILDRSGSMSSLTDEVINSFNHFIEKQKAEPGKATVTLVLFDNEYEVIHDNVKLSKVPKLTNKEYFARGMTGMYDAIGEAITSSKSKNAIVLIQTDGMENSSKEYTGSQIKELIKSKEDNGWDFIFLGADINVAEEANKFGLSAGKSFAYTKSAAGMDGAFAQMNSVTTSYRVNTSNGSD